MIVHTHMLAIALALAIAGHAAARQGAVDPPAPGPDPALRNRLIELERIVASQSEVIAQLKSRLGEGAGDEPAASPPTRDPAATLGGLYAIPLVADLMPTTAAEDPEVLAAAKVLALARLRREAEKLAETRTELFLTNWIGRFVFVVAHLVLGIGLWMAWHEFKQAATQRRASEQVPQELSISLQGVALKTSLHGVMIMMIAFAFYFLYLRFVYPVTYIGAPPSG